MHNISEKELQIFRDSKDLKEHDLFPEMPCKLFGFAKVYYSVFGEQNK